MSPAEWFVVWVGGGALLALAVIMLWDIWRGQLSRGVYELLSPVKRDERRFLVLKPDANMSEVMNDSELPAFGEPHPDDAEIVAVERMVECCDEGQWLVTVRYRLHDSGSRLFREGGD